MGFEELKINERDETFEELLQQLMHQTTYMMKKSVGVLLSYEKKIPETREEEDHLFAKILTSALMKVDSRKRPQCFIECMKVIEKYQKMSS